MSQSFERLQRVLELERAQQYKNKSVVGGIRQFVTYWVGLARKEAVDEADQFFVEQVAEILSGYSRLPGIEARADTINNLLQKLRQRTTRVAKVTPTQRVAPAPPVEPPPPRQAPMAATPPPPAAPAPAPAPDPNALQQPITVVKGVGAKLSTLLEKIGVETVEDMLFLQPRRYDDYSTMRPIRRLQYGEVVSVIGTVWTVRARRTRDHKVAVHAVLGDGSGKVQLNFYNQPWLINQLKAGAQIVVSGKVDQYLGRPVFNSPEWEPLDSEQLRTGRIVPVYPLTKGLGANRVRNLTRHVVESYAAKVADPLPEAIRVRHSLFRIRDAVQQLHFPSSQEHLHKARERLAFDEMLLLQLGMLHQRREWQEAPARPLRADPAEKIRLFNALPFDPTGAQRRVIGEIERDMQRDRPMNRLLQGDVGAGKTLVAAAAILDAVKAGVQAALMAPTEILAEQHYKGLSALLEPLGVRVRLLTGSVAQAEKARIYDEAQRGAADLFIGTTALIQEGVEFADLGFVVVDEQHRFGVDQRGALRDKGKGSTHPHLLVMTATPIPRSLALSMYGDLDLSLLDEMPPGRQEILTRWLKESERERAYGFVRRQVEEGRQTYVIFPLIEESETLDLRAATTEYERMQQIFPDLRLGLLHGRMSSADKEAAMRSFYDGEIDVLVSTTVVEVGVDVPNATLIIIEGANRFGLAQLHQLRGRVGRGEHKSYCILISDSTSDDAVERLTALEDTNDGFQLAEKDLQLRGPGEFFGRRQSGLPELQLASILDLDMLTSARDEAQQIVAQDPDLRRPEHQLLQRQVARFWRNAGDVS